MAPGLVAFGACGPLELGGLTEDGSDLVPGGDSGFGGSASGGLVVVAQGGSGEEIGAGGTRVTFGGTGGKSFGPVVTGGTVDVGEGGVGIQSAGAGNTVNGEGGASGGEGGEGGEGGISGAPGEGGHAGEAGKVSGNGGGRPHSPPSCRPSDPNICGVSRESCCETLAVPGGQFFFGGATQPEGRLASVSNFYLDKYEVTVGRFERFRAEYDAWRATGSPHTDEGAHPRVSLSGWQPDWTSNLPVSGDELENVVRSCLGTPFYTGNGASPNFPMNCVSWYIAQAFCIWDGGRLPTELEWEYAASGGDEGRIYPWGDEAPTAERAFFGCFPNLPDYPCNIPPVGSLTAGAGRFGHLDLAGSVEEWVFDTYADRIWPCSDCANVTVFFDENPRVYRGGSWNGTAERLGNAVREGLGAHFGLTSSGFRCARDGVGGG